jgi:hypothetical protein
MRTIQSLALGVGLTALFAAPAVAQQTSASPSARWAPWLGCWQVAVESVDDGAHLLDLLSGTSSARAETTKGAIVCVTPAAEGGATITTRVNDVPVLTETIVADGTQRPVAEADCKGWQKAEWSTLGPRVFARAEIRCSDQPARIVSGLAAMVAGPMWLDVQMIESEGRKSVRVRRYQRAAVQTAASSLSIPRDASTAPLGRKLTLDEIKEATAKVPQEILQAAVLELGTGGYDLKAKQLLELDAVGVPDSVIDLMVAMSYPKRFVVERASSSGGGGIGSFASMGVWDPFTDVWPYLSMFPYAGMWPYMGEYYYPSFYRAHYSPFGYRNWGYLDPYFYYDRPGFVVVDPGGGGGTGVGATPSGEGRVVDGRGYTRIRRNEPDPATRINNGTGNSGWSTASTGNNGTSSSGSGSSGASPGGYSSGGASSGGDRVAVPRPPGQ